MSKRLSTDIIVTPDEIQRMVHIVRGQRVMLDFDLAAAVRGDNHAV